MSWTTEEKLDYLVRRTPWTIVSERSPEGDLLLRVAEIPSAVGSGETEEAAAADLWESLTESLRAYLHFGDEIPLPKVVKALPWLSAEPRPALVIGMRPNAEMFPERFRTSFGQPLVETDLVKA